MQSVAAAGQAASDSERADRLHLLVFAARESATQRDAYMYVWSAARCHTTQLQTGFRCEQTTTRIHLVEQRESILGQQSTHPCRHFTA